MPEYETIDCFPSSGRSGKFYTVKRNVANNKLSCDCPAWVFNKYKDRTCYHTKTVEAKVIVSLVSNPVSKKGVIEEAVENVNTFAESKRKVQL